jgi:hypothetical protein
MVHHRHAAENGVIGKLHAKFQTIPNFQSIIHQEVLHSKVLNVNDVLKRVQEITNFIQACGLNHWQFASLLRNLEYDYKDLPYYTEICCFTRC